ncbi:hypothetical protein [Paucibacter sp. DJ2R-2]|uniref:hypothetical protein n=1 Tax=Paucibacter sp. DJ2R-2 TaxID=2893558 RepID=UPI0021E38A28|nr:hypothetical protein [Paucibacter sp. DJ2R-2]MCV2420318.1 hypothetical protein [Paucibacter sp. DJ4R-1]MCV2436737.1 hypothetical protein [Paucibacter sp. DJ2R-2]
MHNHSLRLSARATAAALLALGSVALTAPASAGGLSASSASESVGTSIGSLSTSVQKSSESSSGDKKVAAGDYKIIEVAEAPGRPGQMRLSLQAKDATADGQSAEQFFLFLPQTTLAAAGLENGQWVSARPTSYGLEFSRQATQQAFFLVLDDAFYRELPSRAVTL